MTTVLAGPGVPGSTVRPALPGAPADDAEYAAARHAVMGYIVSQTLVAVVRAGVFDALTDGPRPVPELARTRQVDADALRRMLGVLAGEDLVDLDRDVVTLTPRGRFFCAGTPGSLAHLCELMSEEAFTCWTSAGTALRTGRAGFDAVTGQPYFGWLADHPEAEARFHAGQAGLVSARLQPLLDLDWSGTRTVVDVGAGNGRLLADLLTAHPHLTGVGLDVPAAVAEGNAALSDRGLTGRARITAGDFFAAVPAGGDVYVLSQVLHDWPDDAAVTVLRRCRAAMHPGARLLVLEQVVPDEPGRHPARLLDLHMLVLLGGRERTRRQWTELFGRAGLQLTEVRGGARSSLLVARPADAPAPAG